MTGRELRQYVRTGLQNRLVHLVGMYTRNDAPPKVRQDIEDTLAMTHFVCRVADDDEDYSGLHNVPIGRTDTVIKMAMDRVADVNNKAQIRDAMIYAIGQNVPIEADPDVIASIRREGTLPMRKDSYGRDYELSPADVVRSEAARIRERQQGGGLDGDKPRAEHEDRGFQPK